MNLLYADEFRKQFQRLPADIRRIYQKQESLFTNDWRDSRLHLKKMKGSPFFSFRVTRHYRVLFLFTERDTVLFAAIGHRREVYRK